MNKVMGAAQARSWNVFEQQVLYMDFGYFMWHICGNKWLGFYSNKSFAIFNENFFYTKIYYK